MFIRSKLWEFNIIPANISQYPNAIKNAINQLKNLYNNRNYDVFVYVRPGIKKLRPDLIVIDMEKGVTLINVLELKLIDFEEVNRKNIKTSSGQIFDNLVFKANQNLELCRGIFNTDDRLFDEEGYLKFQINSLAFFPNLNQSEFEQNLNNFDQPPTRCFTSKEISNIKLIDINENNFNLTSNDIKLIRSILFPEIKIYDAIRAQEFQTSINKDTISETLKSLDEEQEQFAKRLPYGHYMVTGVPGSGKTVMLLSRALYLIKENPQWKILIVTYNRSLASRLENRINTFAEDYDFMEINYSNIEVKTFSKMALLVSNINIPQNAGDQFWQKDLCDAALSKASPLYDAILIDEYQDFYDDWIKLCVKLCKTHSYINNSGEKTEGINLFLAGDRLQSIYNEREQSFAQLGINMQGRSKLLKKTYRTGSQHINLALDFLMQEDSLKSEVEKFYEGRTGIDNESKIENKVEYIEGQYSDVAILIDNLIFKANYKPEEILVLCITLKNCESLYNSLNDRLRNKAIVSKDLVENMTTITTYFSSKGLEGSVCILCDTDQLPYEYFRIDNLLQRKLLYVGMTRATQTLYLHASSFNNHSYGNIVKNMQM